ncbi:MAG: hypothetical protein JXX14_20610 [Deltaproteobacteria bacterium]|nr:hypothetical protein [Deltaproteobacteria bacterium]
MNSNLMDSTSATMAYPDTGTNQTGTTGNTDDLSSEAVDTSNSDLVDPCNAPGETIYVVDNILSDASWTCNNTYVLDGGVFVGDATHSAVLHIAPGTVILGSSQRKGFLKISRGSQIRAEGTLEKPIVFTSDRPRGQRHTGDWAGLFIDGSATINDCLSQAADGSCERISEAVGGWYGGSDDGDSSGVLRYVRVEFAGADIVGDAPCNGITLNGVGSGTIVEYVQVHRCGDDGIELFGGTVNLKHIYISGVSDDSLGWRIGWRGNAQFMVFQHLLDTHGDQGIEGESNSDDPLATPVSYPVLSNVTIIGPNDAASPDYPDIGILLREGTGADIYNAIVANYVDACLDIDNEHTWRNLAAGNLRIAHSMISCGVDFLEWDEQESFEGSVETDFFFAGEGNSVVDDSADILNGYYSINAAQTGASIPVEPFFDTVVYIGGVTAADNWLSGWTTDADK